MCHKQIVDAYLKGADVLPGDRVVLLDLLPNRLLHGCMELVGSCIHVECMAHHCLLQVR